MSAAGEVSCHSHITQMLGVSLRKYALLSRIVAVARTGVGSRIHGLEEGRLAPVLLTSSASATITSSLLTAGYFRQMIVEVGSDCALLCLMTPNL
jgi:hypothetical protein